MLRIPLCVVVAVSVLHATSLRHQHAPDAYPKNGVYKSINQTSGFQSFSANVLLPALTTEWQKPGEKQDEHRNR